MKRFLRDYWLYVAVPVALVLIAVAVVALTSDDPATPFKY